MFDFYRRAKAAPSRKIGFTLLELVVVTVVVAILAAVGVTTYTNVITTARDKAHLASLSILARDAQVIYAAGQPTTTWVQALAAASAETTLAAPMKATAPTPGEISLSGPTDLTYVPATNVISYATTPPETSIYPTGTLALASQTSSGNCALAVTAPTGVLDSWVLKDLGSNCTGATAFGGPAASELVTYELPANYGPPAPVLVGTLVTQPGITTIPNFTLTPSISTDVSGMQVRRNGVLIATIPADSTTYADQSAAPATTYTYTFTPIDIMGLLGTPTESVVTTKPGTLSSGALASDVSAGDATVTLTWDAPAAGSVFTGYRILIDGTLVSTITDPTATSALLTGQVLGVATEYTVQPYNASGVGVGFTTTQTLTGTPAAATSITATAANASIDLSWTPVAPTASYPVTGYNLYSSTSASGPFTLLAMIVGAAATTYTDAPAVNGTTYYYQAETYGTGGTSARSATSAVVTPVGLPTCSAALASASSPTTGSIAYTCSSSAANPTTGVRVYNHADATLMATDLASPVLVPGLTAGMTYTFEIEPYNAVNIGTRILTNALSTISAPTATSTITPIPADSLIQVTWSAVVGTSAKPVDSYILQAATSATGPWSTLYSGAALTHTQSGLTNGDAYYYRVAAVNAAGTGNYSAVESAVPVAIAAAPVSPVAVAGNTSVALSWTPVTTTAAIPVAGYRIYSSTISTGPFILLAQVAGATTASYNNTALTNGITYYYQAETYGAGGTSGRTPTFPAAGVTPVGTPAAVTTLTTTGGAPSVTATWALPAVNAAAPVTGVVITLNGATVTTLASSATSYAFTGLSSGAFPGTTYTLGVKTINAVTSSTAVTVSKQLYTATSTTVYTCSGGGTSNGAGGCGTYQYQTAAAYSVPYSYWVSTGGNCWTRADMPPAHIVESWVNNYAWCSQQPDFNTYNGNTWQETGYVAYGTTYYPATYATANYPAAVITYTYSCPSGGTRYAQQCVI